MPSEDKKSERIESKVDDLVQTFHSIDKKVALLDERIDTHFEQDTRNLDMIREALEGINQGITDLRSQVSTQERNLREYNESLQAHMARTKAVEDQNDLITQMIGGMKEFVDATKKQIDDRLDEVDRPRQWAITTYEWSKWIAAVAVPAGMIWAAIRHFS
jgi:archaellum component FlaC